jgi:hypothetical protein
LKAIFLSGMDADVERSARIAHLAERTAALDAELLEARESLRRVEAGARSLQRERDALLNESGQLREILDRRRTSRQVRLALGAVLIAGIAGGGWLAASNRAFHLTDKTAQADASPFFRNGVVHERNVALRKDPDSGSPSLAMLTEGTQVVVHRTLWHNLQQWVEVEVGGQTGFVLSTEVNLS